MENLNKDIDCLSNQGNKNIASFINEFFRKPNRLYTIHFNSSYEFSTISP